MSILAGIYSRHETEQIPDAMGDALKRLISRNAEDEINVFKDPRTYLVKLDVGAFGEPGFYVDADGGTSLLAGELLLSVSDAGEYPSRESDLVTLHDGLKSENPDVLTTAQGVFCAVNYQPDKAVLRLITDKLGVRPLYYWLGEKYIVFSSALRVLEEFSEIPKKMNVRAVTEIVGLGYALGDRTPYDNIFLLKAGQILQVKNNDISAVQYWRWDELETSCEPEEKLLEELYRSFKNAVARRLRRDTTTIAYLSGGLDSRCVVGALGDLKARVHTFNFARPNTQDQILGRDFAQKSGVIHTEIPKEPGDHIPDYSAKMTEAWSVSKNRAAYPVERPQLVWSGEGGSVDLGHVHVGRKIVELMRAGQTDSAIEEYMAREDIYVSPKLIHPRVFIDLSGVIQKGVAEELAALRSKDPARRFYLFLMLNDQRRKLAGHFENIDLHRLEFQLPFFDSSFLELIVSIPVDLCLEHKLYVKWLDLFPPSVASVAWQAYPGHEPCPLPVPEGLSYQWDKKYQTTEQNSLKRVLTRQARELLSARDFPTDILSKKNIRLAAWIHRTGWRDYGYIIETARVYHKYWRICKGAYTI